MRRDSSHDAVGRAAERTQVNAVLHVVLLQLGEDVFAVRVLPQGGNVGSDLEVQARVSHIHVNQWSPARYQSMGQLVPGHRGGGVYIL